MKKNEKQLAHLWRDIKQCVKLVQKTNYSCIIENPDVCI